MKIQLQMKTIPLEKIKTTNVNILLNRVKLDEKKDAEKKIVFISIMVSILLGVGLFSIIT